MSKLHYLALSQIKGVGPVFARELLKRYGSMDAVFNAPETELISFPRMTEQILEDILRTDLKQYEGFLEKLQSDNVDLLTWEDIEFPENLLEAHTAPYLIYVAGALSPADNQAVAVVGTREPSDSSLRTAFSLAKQLAEAGITVVSGLAVGIDTAAHQGALAADNGRTIAVLGSGLSRIHPSSNVELAGQIIDNGCIITEYAPNTPPNGQNLMARDRIISGMSRAVIVVEATADSGSVDTGKKAIKQDRKVFAVPGSPGTDQLIKLGAQPFDPKHFVVEYILTTTHPEPKQHNEQLSLF